MYGQFDTQGAQVLSYLPQLADGGPTSQQWITNFTFVNPHTTSGTSGFVFLYEDDGSPLTLDLGSGPQSTFSFFIPPQGTVVFTSKGTSSAAAPTTGWALVLSTLPIQAVVQYRYSANGIPQQGVSALATEASIFFRSPASSQTGVALANVYGTSSISLQVSALNTNGINVANTSITLPPFGHKSFTVAQVFPGLAPDFRGTVTISPTLPGYYTIAWTLSTDLGVLASYPPSALNWPTSQYERIWKVWLKIMNVAASAFPLGTPPKLVVDYSTGQINSFANPALNEVHIFMNLAELISDSESELSFVVAHEIGHIIQARIGQLAFVPGNREYDADQYGMLLSLAAGYDPYGAAGALAKLSMASGDSSLLSQNFDNYVAIAGVDLHGSFNNRLALIFQVMQTICGSPQYQGFCALYKTAIHPHLPPISPLSRK
jgi:Zn-dependent protease with chaperone function